MGGANNRSRSAGSARVRVLINFTRCSKILLKTPDFFLASGDYQFFFCIKQLSILLLHQATINTSLHQATQLFLASSNPSISLHQATPSFSLHQATPAFPCIKQPQTIPNSSLQFAYMAQASLSSTTNTTNSSTTMKVPFEERNNVKTPADLHGVVVRYQLGEAAIADTVNKAQQLRKKVATVINRHAVDDVGIVQTRWRKQPFTQRSHMVKNLVNSASWLANFEGDWATEWLLRRQIDMRHSEGQRKPKEKSRNISSSTGESSGTQVDLQQLRLKRSFHR